RSPLPAGRLSARPPPPGGRLGACGPPCRAVRRPPGPGAWGWPPGGQLLPPPSPAGPPLMGWVNIRLFRVEGSASDVVMDTLGLQVFGLPDLQCHCHEIELPRLATYLRNAANYVFERGDVIRDGDTIEGIEPGEKWRCLQEEALIPPHRLVIEPHPRGQFAAGGGGPPPGGPQPSAPPALSPAP